MDEERALRNSFAELAARAAEGSYYTYSDFLTLAEQDTLQSMQLPTAFTLTGGYDGAERRIAVFGSEQKFGYHPEPPLAYIRIAVRAPRFAEPLSHRDYLGSILGLGLERDVTGDILPAENEAYLICLDTVADFIAESLVKVRHTDVECTRISELPPVSVPEPVECTVFAASERADALCAAVWGLSRSESESLFSAKLVFADARLVTAPDARLRPGASVSVRGHGKFIYCGISKTTRKGRLCVNIKKYV